MRYAIVYLSVPLGSEDDEPTEADAQIIGEVVQKTIDSATPLYGVELMGTRLARNKLIAPGLIRHS